MNVFLLIEEYEQDIYTNKKGTPASPFSSVIGVYGEKEKAEREKKAFEAQKESNSGLAYFVEERPLL